MKGTALIGLLKNKISIAERFVGKNAALPFLNNILLEIKNNNAYVTATNLEIACSLTFKIKDGKDGISAVPANSLSLFIQSLPSEQKFTFEEKSGSLFFETNTSKTKVNTVSVKDFPLLPKIKSDNVFIFNTVEFQNALKTVISSASLTQLKPELNGILVIWNKAAESLTVVATDTFRLAEKNIKLKKQKSDSFSFIMPFRFAQELIRFETEENEGECVFGESQIKFCFGEDELISNLISGSFPKYQDIIPKKFEIHIEIDAKKLTDAVKSTGFFSSKLNDVLLRASNKNFLEIHSENSDIGETTITIPAKIEGKYFQISFNHKFLLDGISAVSGDIATILINNEFSPALIRGSGASYDFTYLIMPIKGI